MKRVPKLTAQTAEDMRQLRDDLRAAMIAAVQGANPGEKEITLWDGMRAAVRAAEGR